MTTYEVTVSRENPWWVAEVAGIPGGATESRSLSGLEGEVHDLLSGLFDADPASFNLDWQWAPVLGEAAQVQLQEFRRTRKQLRAAQLRYEKAQRDTVMGLREAGLSVRDAASLLDISFQRVQQVNHATRQTHFADDVAPADVDSQAARSAG